MNLGYLKTQRAMADHKASVVPMTYEGIGQTARALNDFQSEKVDGVSISKVLAMSANWTTVRNSETNGESVLTLTVKLSFGEATSTRITQLADTLVQLGWTIRRKVQGANAAGAIIVAHCVAP